MNSYFSLFAINDHVHRNKSSDLEVTSRLIEHSWIRCKFGASRLAGLHDLHLSRGFIVHHIWIVWLVSREIVARRNNVDKAELSARRMEKGGSIVCRKKNGPLLRRSMTAVDPYFSFTGRLLSLTTVEPARLIASSCKQWRSFQLLNTTRTPGNSDCGEIFLYLPFISTLLLL